MLPFRRFETGDVLLPGRTGVDERLRRQLVEWQKILGDRGHRFKVRWSKKQKAPWKIKGIEEIVLALSGWSDRTVHERWRIVATAMVHHLYRRDRNIRNEALAKLGFHPEE